MASGDTAKTGRCPARTLSLIEVIMAMAVLTMAFAGSMSLYYTTATFSRSSAERTEARTLASAELAVLRRTVRTAPLVTQDVDNRERLYGDGTSFPGEGVIVADPNGAFPNNVGATWTRTRQVPMNRGRSTATIVTTLIYDEQVAGASFGPLDLNADGLPDQAGAIASADLWALPVTVTVTWTTAEGQGATETLTVSGILY